MSKREELVALLEAHRLHASINICQGCDWRATVNAGSLDEQHRRHIADALAPMLAGWLAEAWDFGYACGLGDYGKADDETCSANPYRQEQADE